MSLSDEQPRFIQAGDASGYDLIGDIHGCAQTLQRLLEQLGYRKQGGVYWHPQRKVIFLGDVVDRGPRIREALHIVRDMVERGSAQMIMGNHEFNALTYCTPLASGSHEYLRPHIAANARQIAETLHQFADYPEEWREFLEWFKGLPLFLEISHPHTGQVFRAVHACWDQQLIDHHWCTYGSNKFTEEFLYQSVVPGSQASLTKQRLTGGIELALPMGISITSEDGYIRKAFRTKFWATHAQNYGELLFQPDPLPEHLAKAPISHEHRAQMLPYAAHEPPLFVGHYWLKGHPEPLTPNLACLDYSAVKFGRLVAYRMDGEAQLSADKFAWVYVDP